MLSEIKSTQPSSSTKNFRSLFGYFVVGVVMVYGLIYLDVLSRARESYQEAEKYMEWYRDPSKKEAALTKQFDTEKKWLDVLHEKNKITEPEYRRKLEALEFDRNFQLQESSLKYAYQWYKDTYELFSPPESKWVRLARTKAPETLELWKQELRQKKIPFEEYMFQ